MYSYRVPQVQKSSSFIFVFVMLGLCPAAARSARALTIIPTFDGSIANDPNADAIESTINTAISAYETQFSDPINVTINFQSTRTGGLGQSNWWYYAIDYSTFLNALSSDATTPHDATALAYLPATTTNPVTAATTINLKTANIRALGIAGDYPSGLFGGVDGIITLNTSATAPPGIGAFKYSLLTITEHEIDEVLGLGSGLDSRAGPFAEDLFRFAAGLSGRNYTTAGDNAYLSIDGGTTDLARFNQNSGADHGDWWTAGPHGPQVQDAFITQGATPLLGAELTALDVIGYDLAAPEPGTALSLAVGFATILRRRKVRSHMNRSDIFQPPNP